MFRVFTKRFSLLYFIVVDVEMVLGIRTKNEDGAMAYSFADHSCSFADQNRAVTEMVTDSYGNVVVKKYSYY